MNLIIFGAPGAGKGTHAKFIAEKTHVPQISTGDILRAAVKNGTHLGIIAKKHMDSGSLVPDDVVVGIVRERLAEKDCAKGYILDGFPRTVTQATELDKFAKIELVLNMEVSEDELVKRLTSRRTCTGCGAIFNLNYQKPKVEGKCDKCGANLYQRDDDNEKTVRNRLATYNRETAPVLGHYASKGVVKSIDGNHDIEVVKKQVLKAAGIQ